MKSDKVGKQAKFGRTASHSHIHLFDKGSKDTPKDSGTAGEKAKLDKKPGLSVDTQEGNFTDSPKVQHALDHLARAEEKTSTGVVRSRTGLGRTLSNQFAHFGVSKELSPIHASELDPEKIGIIRAAWLSMDEENGGYTESNMTLVEMQSFFEQLRKTDKTFSKTSSSLFLAMKVARKHLGEEVFKNFRSSIKNFKVTKLPDINKIAIFVKNMAICKETKQLLWMTIDKQEPLSLQLTFGRKNIQHFGGVEGFIKYFFDARTHETQVNTFTGKMKSITKDVCNLLASQHEEIIKALVANKESTWVIDLSRNFIEDLKCSVGRDEDIKKPYSYLGLGF